MLKDVKCKLKWPKTFYYGRHSISFWTILRRYGLIWLLPLGILVSKSSVMFVVQFLIKTLCGLKASFNRSALCKRLCDIASISQIVFVQNIQFSNIRDLKYFGRVKCAVKLFKKCKLFLHFRHLLQIGSWQQKNYCLAKLS